MGEQTAFGEALRLIAESQIAAHPPKDGDYLGDDGYLYCGKCRTRKQYEITIDGEKCKVPSMCQCEQEKRRQEEEFEKKRKQMERIERLKKNSLMDEKFKSCSFDTVSVTDSNRRQLKVCKRYAEKFGEMLAKNQGLLLYGDVGTGKTHFACCIGNYVMEHLSTVFATSLIKILQKAKSFRDADDEEAYISRLNYADLLILDDLGAERSTDYALEIVYNVIDSRYRSGKPMIVTTNLTLDEMRDTPDLRYRRIYDRIFEVCYPLEFVGKSWRMKEAASRFDEMKSLLED